MPSPLLAIAALSMTIQPGWAEPEAAQSDPDAPRVYRVEGDPETYQVSIDGDLYRSGASFTEAALPEGYPAPTPPWRSRPTPASAGRRSRARAA